MKILTEEVFGPIAPVIIVQDEDEAVRVANDTEFGLGASIWSRNLDRAEKLRQGLKPALWQSMIRQNLTRAISFRRHKEIRVWQRTVALWAEGVCEH